MSTTARLTLDQYDRMISAGVFDQRERLEFIQGEIRAMTPIGSLHEDIVDRLMDWSVRNTSRDEVRVRVQNSVGLPSLQSAPEPDLAWVRQREYASGRPTSEDVLLIVEVADSSLAYDRGEKSELYARAGIADYWIVSIPDRAIEVRRDPTGDHYASLATYRGNEEINPLCDGGLFMQPSLLFGG